MSPNLSNPEIADATPVGFADCYLGLNDLAQWQAAALMPLMKAKVGGKKVNVTVVAPNGSGKDQRIIPTAVYWWLFFFPKGRVVITSKSDLQIREQTIPAIDTYWNRFGWEAPIKSPHYTLRNGKGKDDEGKAIAFVTNDAGRVEGWHERPGSPLLEIINEAKSVDLPIFTAFDRCTPTARLHISSPGLREGRFYEEHASIAGWVRVKAGLADCPWISKEKIDEIIATYGPDHPFTRSTLHGEFMSQAGDEWFCLLTEQFDSCINLPPPHRPGFRYGFFDFADGRAKNVFVVRDGNKYEIVDAWREQNEDAVVGRAIWLINNNGLTAQQVGGDAAAKGILDKMESAGYPIYRQNFGQIIQHNQYKSWSAWAWIEGCRKILNREVIIPNNEELRKQLTTRRRIFTPDGRMAVETKQDMQKRGIDSPDEGDALLGCMAAVDTNLLMPRKTIFEQLEEETRDYGLGSFSVGL